MNVQVSAITTVLDSASAYQVDGSPILDSYDIEGDELVFRWIDHEGEYEQSFLVSDLAGGALSPEPGRILAKNTQGELTWIQLFDLSPAKDLSRSLVPASAEDRGFLEPKPKTILVECYCLDEFVDDAATHVALKLTQGLCDRISLIDSARQALGCDLIGEYVEAVWLNLDDHGDHDISPMDLNAQELERLLVSWEEHNQVPSAPTELLIKDSGIVLTSRAKQASESCQVFSRTVFPNELTSSQVCFRRDS